MQLGDGAGASAVVCHGRVGWSQMRPILAFLRLIHFLGRVGCGFKSLPEIDQGQWWWWWRMARTSSLLLLSLAFGESRVDEDRRTRESGRGFEEVEGVEAVKAVEEGGPLCWPRRVHWGAPAGELFRGGRLLVPLSLIYL